MSKKTIIVLIFVLVFIGLVITFNYFKSKNAKNINTILYPGIITGSPGPDAGLPVPGITPAGQPDPVISMPTLNNESLNKLTRLVHKNLTSINYGWLTGNPQLNVMAITALLGLPDADLKYVAEAYSRFYGEKLVKAVDDEIMPATDVDEKLTYRLAALGYTLY